MSLNPKRPVLPEWTRWAWASLMERDYWQPLIQRASLDYVTIEREAVAQGIRPACYQPVAPEQLLDVSVWATRRGLVVVPITQIDKTTGYSSGSGQQVAGRAQDLRCLITTPDRMAILKDIPNIASNDVALGEFLGYPTCCRDFFMKTWATGQVDTTWDQFSATGSSAGSLEANMLWRWFGIRWVSHLPCSFQCQHTIQQGQALRQLMKAEGLHESAHTIDTVLSWPVRWSGINGIAEIVGPCVKVSTRTDWAPPSAHRRFERIGRYSKPHKEQWTQNGFGSFHRMFTAHEPLVKTISEFTSPNGIVLDLGCGNGALLRRVKRHRPDVTLVGYDVNADAIQAAQTVGVGEFHHANLKDATMPPESAPETTVVINPIRLAEMTPDDAQRTRAMLATARTIIVYEYDDALKNHTLSGWVASVGLPVERLLVTYSTPVVSVGVIENAPAPG